MRKKTTTKKLQRPQNSDSLKTVVVNKELINNIPILNKNFPLYSGIFLLQF